MYISTSSFKVGDKVRNTRILKSLGGHFEINTPLTIIDVDSMRGYSVADEFGNKITECGWDGFKNAKE